MTFALLGWLSERGAVYALADLTACAVVWLVQLALVVLIFFGKTSASFYQHEPARQ